MSGRHKWSDIRHKRDLRSMLPEAPAGHPVDCACGEYQECVVSYDPPTEEELEAARKHLAPYLSGYPEPMIDTRRLRIAEGVATKSDIRQIRAEDQVIREHREKPHTVRPTGGGDIPPPRMPTTALRDYEQVDRMIRHTRPVIDPKDDELYVYSDQGDASDRLYEFISSHILAMKMKRAGYSYIHDKRDCKHCQAKDDLDLLNRIIKSLWKKLNEYTDAMAIQHEMYGDPEELLRRAEEAEAALASCNVQLHDNKSHRLGLMCAEAQEKLNRIARVVQQKHLPGDAEWLADEILDILDGD